MTDVNQELLEALQQMEKVFRKPSPPIEEIDALQLARATIALAQDYEETVDLTVPEIHQTMSRCLDCGVITPTEDCEGRIVNTPTGYERGLTCPACGSDNI